MIKNRTAFCLVKGWINLFIWGPKNTLLKQDCVLYVSVTLNAYGCIRRTALGFKGNSYIFAKYTVPLPRREKLKNISIFPILLTLLFRFINHSH